MPKMVNKPVHEVRYRNVKAAVWLNQTVKGTMHNVTLSRSYREGEQWKNSFSFGPTDLLPLAKALNEAHTWIHQQLRRLDSRRFSTAAAATVLTDVNQSYRPSIHPAIFEVYRRTYPSKR